MAFVIGNHSPDHERLKVKDLCGVYCIMMPGDLDNVSQFDNNL